MDLDKLKQKIQDDLSERETQTLDDWDKGWFSALAWVIELIKKENN